ncbi:MAG: CPBP family intramembrane glutamic endopeptidase [Chloroflexota bacterium]
MGLIKTIFLNETEARLRAGWRVVIQLLLNIGFVVLISGLIRSRSTTNSTWYKVILAPIAVGVTLFSVWFAGHFLDRRRFSDFGLDPNRTAWWADFAFGLALGIVLPLGVALAGGAAGLVRFESAFISGFPGLSFGSAVLFLAFVCLCVGVFEEVGRAYQIRNLLEGAVRGFGLRIAALLAVIGASTISVLMHSGNLTFLVFVLLATMIKGLCYLLTRRVGIGVGYHAAWNFAVATILGIGSQSDSSGATAFYVMRSDDAAWALAMNSNELTLPVLLALLGLELVALLLILGWVRLRYGNVRVCEDFATPTLREPVSGRESLRIG